MPTKGTVVFSKESGPITLEITCGYITLGSFTLSYAKKGDYNFVEFGDNPKRLDDDKRDIFLIPIKLDELKNFVIVINGKYSPAFNHNEINVKYTFVQGTKELKVTPVDSAQIQDTTSEPFKRYSIFFYFEEMA